MLRAGRIPGSVSMDPAGTTQAFPLEDFDGMELPQVEQNAVGNGGSASRT